MTNLTEQWKKGELPEGDYYLDIGSDTIIDYWVCNHWNWTEYDSRIKAVLCEVPTYGEYQELLSDQLAKNEGVEINTELEAENTKLKSKLQLKETAYDFDTARLEEENTKLKELLKGAKEIIEWYKADYGYIDIPTEVTLQHINQVLGEE